MMPVCPGRLNVTRGLLTSGSPFPCGKTSAAGFVPLNFPFIGFHQRRRTAGHPRSPARRYPTFRSSPGGLRRRASVGRQSVSCFHTQPVGDTHGSLFAPTSPALRAAVPVLRPVPRLPPLTFYNQTFYKNSPPFIEKSFSVRNRHSRWLSARSSASGLISQGCTEFLRDFTDRR